MVKSRLQVLVLLPVLLLVFLSCASKPQVNPEGPYWTDNDRQPIPEPEFKEPPLIWTSVDRTVFDQTLELLDLDRGLRKLSGRPTQAQNTNCLDEVPNSSWFTNRHGLPQTSLTPYEITTGVAITAGPDTTGGWTVFRPKIGGVTPGFWIIDGRGDKYIIKFDPPGFPDMSTGATVMAGKFFHACGYNVAQETIVYWRPDNLRIKEGVTVKGADGKKRPFTMEDLNDILASVHYQPDGGIRSLASLLLGNVKGPYMLKGTDKNDPNDWCPHEHRRELRGLYVLASFVNHWDIKDHNSMNTYVGEAGQGYLKHYLMDFGSTFGSGGHNPCRTIDGYANTMDVRDMIMSVATLGLKTWPWENALPWTNPSVGYFEAEIFHPGKWDPIYPIPPFENMTDQDGYWGAKIVMAFSDEDLQALLKAGQYSDPVAEEMLFEILKERRDKIGRHWFGKINPLDHPILKHYLIGLDLSFEDLAVEYGLEPGTADYEYCIYHEGRAITNPAEIEVTQILLSNETLRDMASRYDNGNDNSAERHLFEVKIKTRRQGGQWSQPVIFLLWYHPDTDTFTIAGIEHPG
ncbi:MAG: hypothetical protein GY841_22310 [FCB group bacterium]|nr:hypothetical protein [FCB group bacterium]